MGIQHRFIRLLVKTSHSLNVQQSKTSQVKMSKSQNVPSQNAPKSKRLKSKRPKSKRPKVKTSQGKTSQSQSVPFLVKTMFICVLEQQVMPIKTQNAWADKFVSDNRNSSDPISENFWFERVYKVCINYFWTAWTIWFERLYFLTWPRLATPQRWDNKYSLGTYVDSMSCNMERAKMSSNWYCK